MTPELTKISEDNWRAAQFGARKWNPLDRRGEGFFCAGWTELSNISKTDLEREEAASAALNHQVRIIDWPAPGIGIIWHKPADAQKPTTPTP